MFNSAERDNNEENKADISEEPNDDTEKVDNSKILLHKMATLYADKLMSDIALEVQGERFAVHRLILCATSDVFQVMLLNREWTEWGESRIVLQETPECAAVFSQFINYFYTGQITIKQTTVIPLLALADKYNVNDLVNLCVCYMRRHVAHAAQRGQLVGWMQYTMACGHSYVAQACQNFVKWNLEMVVASCDFGNLEPEVLIYLLQQDDLVIYNEMSLYQYVVQWLEKQKERLLAPERGFTKEEAEEHWESIMMATLAHIRYPMMCPRQLASLLLSPLTQQYKDFFLERMSIAMSYQSGQTEHMKTVQATEGGRLIFSPRLYTEDTWSSTLSVEGFHSMQCYHTRTFVFSTRNCLAENIYWKGDSGIRNCRTEADKTCEWVVDLYPKGVWFSKAMMIMWTRTHEIPEVVLRSVRLAIACRDPPPPPRSFTASHDEATPHRRVEADGPDMRVKIAILVWGAQRGVEHVRSVVESVHRFSYNQRLINVDDAVDFDELNTPLYTPSSSSNTSSNMASGVVGESCKQCHESGRCVSGGRECGCGGSSSTYLIGPDRDQLKIQIIILPLTDECYVKPPDVSRLKKT